MQPALSIGNVGQLAVDLLVASTRAERIGYLDTPYVLPCVGNDAYGPVPNGELALPLEGLHSLTSLSYLALKRKICFLNEFIFGFAAYDSSANAMTLIQQRSPVVKVRLNLLLHIWDCFGPFIFLVVVLCF